MINPCKECVVRPVCTSGCDKLVGFLKENLRPQYRFFYSNNANYEGIAKCVRTRAIYLHDNDTRWSIFDYENESMY